MFDVASKAAGLGTRNHRGKPTDLKGHHVILTWHRRRQTRSRGNVEVSTCQYMETQKWAPSTSNNNDFDFYVVE